MKNPPTNVMGETMNVSGKIDLGEIALSLVFRSCGYAILSFLAAAVGFLLLRIAGYESFTDSGIWGFTFIIWAILQAEILIRLWRLSRTSLVIVNSSHTIHGLELCAAGFLLLFSLALPYLTESDASAYPYLKRLFQLLIGVTAFFHLLVLGIFRRRPTKWDKWSLVGAILAACVPPLLSGGA